VEAEQVQEDSISLDDYATTDPGAQQVEVSASAAEVPADDGDAALQSLMDWCARKIEESEEGSFAAIKRIVRDTLASKTPDEVLREQLPTSGRDFVDRPFIAFGFGLTESEFSESDGCPFYANLDIAIGNPPKRRVVNVGSWKVMAQLMMLDLMGEWPQTLVIRQKKRATKKGYFPLSLVRPD